MVNEVFLLLERRGVVGDIRHVTVAEPFGGDGQSALWAATRLAGQELIDHATGEAVALLEPLSPANFVLRQYTGGPTRRANGPACRR